MKIKALVVTFAVWVAAGAICFAANPAIGTWKLNEAQSKIPKAMAKNKMVVYKSGRMGKTTVIVDGVDAKGKATHNEWTGKFDGKDYAVTGDPMQDMRSYKRIDDRNLDFWVKKGGKVTVSGHVAISADGKTRTVATTAMMNGKNYKSMGVYDRQ
ncbi:MAG TPA: hypothetical protein VFQ78_02685 [Candidatus Udaeobacter sp.]|jgi:hypothetical protein|nr:hypothetical protein [Candidatus Udaeobacter sp.]